MSDSNGSGFERPFPALTPAQRYHLDVFGYVVVPGTLAAEETGRLLAAMQRLKADLVAAGEGAVVRGCRLGVNRPHHRHFAHILEADPAIYDYLTHPRLVGMAEELVGGEVRLEESEAVINEPDPGDPPGPGIATASTPALAPTWGPTPRTACSTAPSSRP